jgi:hypothetical protein
MEKNDLIYENCGFVSQSVENSILSCGNFRFRIGSTESETEMKSFPAAALFKTRAFSTSDSSLEE